MYRIRTVQTGLLKLQFCSVCALLVHLLFIEVVGTNFSVLEREDLLKLLRLFTAPALWVRASCQVNFELLPSYV